MKNLLTTALLLLLVHTLFAQQEVYPILQNTLARETISLDGSWKIIVDPLENGYYNYRYEPRGDGYFKNAKPQKQDDLIE